MSDVSLASQARSKLPHTTASQEAENGRKSIVFTLGVCPWSGKDADLGTCEAILAHIGWYSSGSKITDLMSNARKKLIGLHLKLLGGGAVSWITKHGAKEFGGGKFVLSASQQKIAALGAQLKQILQQRPDKQKKRTAPAPSSNALGPAAALERLWSYQRRW